MEALNIPARSGLEVPPLPEELLAMAATGKEPVFFKRVVTGKLTILRVMVTCP